MGEIEKQKKTSIILSILLFFSILTIGLLISSSSKINNLDRTTISSLTNCVLDNDNKFEHLKNINEILNQYEDERKQINQNTVNNGITSLLITLLIILTSIKRIIKTFKSIIKDIFNGNVQKEKNKEYSIDLSTNMDRGELLIKINEYQQLKELIEELNINKEKDKQQDEKIMTIEQNLMKILADFAGTLGHTSNCTNQINMDREQLQLGINEIKNGMEQISQVINYNEQEDSKLKKEELMAAIEQVYSAMEETGALILSMDKKVKSISNHIELYKKGKN